MKFFLDTANVEDIKKAVDLGMCDGVTTNPTLIMKSGRNHKEVIQAIAKVMKGPLSIEVNAEGYEEMVKEGTEYSKWATNAVIKLPMTKDGLLAVRALSEKGIKTNVTLIFSAAQALLAAKAGATYVSPFVGRLDDIGQNGMDVVRDILEIFDNYLFETEVIVASVRSVKHVEDSAKLGADIATIPPKIAEEVWKHELTDKGLAQFKEDYKKSLQHK